MELESRRGRRWVVAVAVAVAAVVAAGAGDYLWAANRARAAEAAFRAKLLAEANQAAKDLVALAEAGANVKAQATKCSGAQPSPVMIALHPGESLSAKAILQAQRPGCSDVEATVGSWTVEFPPAKLREVLARDVPDGRASVKGVPEVKGTDGRVTVKVTATGKAPVEKALLGLVALGGRTVTVSASAGGRLDISQVLYWVDTESAVASAVAGGGYVQDPGSGGKWVGTPPKPVTPPPSSPLEPGQQSTVAGSTGYVQPPVIYIKPPVICPPGTLNAGAMAPEGECNTPYTGP